MFKVFATNVVVSKGYENNPALKFFGKEDSCVQFRVGEKVYDTNAENNTRWVNHSVKAFGDVCERIKKMQLKEGSLINFTGTLTEEVWTEGEGDKKTKKSAQVIVLDSIEYTSGGSKKPANDTQAQGSSQKKDTAAAPDNNGGKTPEQSENFSGYIYELKLDGIRCIAYIEPKSVNLQNKWFKDITPIYPELSDICKCVKKRVILDGELVVLKNGKPDFYALQRRSLMTDNFKISLASKKNLVQFAAYDILYYDGKDLTDKPLMDRKAVLSKAVKEGNNLSISRWIEKNGVAFFELAKRENLEGIVAKKKEGLYHIGKRTHDWIKIKVMQDEDLLVLGYQSDEDGKVKDLILGYYDENNELKCRGKVYLGVSKEERTIISRFAKNNTVKKPWFDKYKNAVWLKPQLVGTAHFMHETESGGMRQPVWKGLKID